MEIMKRVVLITLVLLVVFGQGLSTHAEAGGSEISCQIILSKTSVSVGETISAEVVLTGGTNPKVVNAFWLVTDGEQEDAFVYDFPILHDVNVYALEILFGVKGTLPVDVENEDGSGAQRFGSDEFGIMGSSTPLHGEIEFDRSFVRRDEPIVAKVSLSGGINARVSEKTYWEVHSMDGSVETFETDITGDFSLFVPHSGDFGRAYFWGMDDLGRERGFLSKEFRIVDATELPGDANADSEVDVDDLLTIIDHLVLGTAPASPANANADGQGGVDLKDLTWVLDGILRK